MEDLIPLVIIILISIVGAIGKKKKQNQQRQMLDDEPVRNKEDIFNWLEQLTDEDKEVMQPVYEPVKAEAKVVNVEPKVKEEFAHHESKFSNYTGFISSNTKENVMSKESSRNVIERHEFLKNEKKTGIQDAIAESALKAKQVKKHDLLHHFNLKQAVLYSEILNRKYQ